MIKSGAQSVNNTGFNQHVSLYFYSVIVLEATMECWPGGILRMSKVALV
jgi:hypothetical protein